MATVSLLPVAAPKLRLALVLVAALLTACNTTPRSSEQGAEPAQQTAAIDTPPIECPSPELEALTQTEPAQVWPKPACPTVKPPKCPVCPAAVIANKPVVGEYELIKVDPPGFNFLARIDTGATSTAIHATSITRFERDGQKWVRFDLSNPDDQQTVTLERKLIRRIRIKQTDDVLDRRLIVMMNLQLGKIERQVEVSLADRSNMEFPLLIGRNFLLDAAVVDVSLRRTAN